ncbi:HipA domain-containing protein [Rhizobium beringeri]
MLAELVRSRFSSPLKTLEELFSRLCFNILVGNTDDHARNHAAFWDGEMLSLTPAYDIAPQRRGTPEANQAMIVAGASRAAQLTNALAVSPSFLLSQLQARAIVDDQAAAIVANWRATCDEAGMTPIERRFLKGARSSTATPSKVMAPPLSFRAEQHFLFSSGTSKCFAHLQDPDTEKTHPAGKPVV